MASKRDRPHPEPSQNPYPKKPETEIGQQARQDYLKYQSPYTQYQVHQQQMKVKVMSEYASSVVQKGDQQMCLERMCFGRALRR
ncbi:MAG: hypothetical protein VKK04_26695 [Synechococcales bacterium]|nr:hypothetical protein [Synechococcales bacterium]